MLELSTSRIDDYFICPQREHYGYREEGCGIVPIIEAPELMGGRLLHIGLETYYNTYDFVKAWEAMGQAYTEQVDYIVANSSTQIWDEDQQRWRDTFDLMIGMLKHYFDYYKGERLEVVETEHEFSVDIKDPTGKAVAKFRGRIDLIVKEGKRYQLWDHKSASQFGNMWEAQNHLNRQYRRYAWAWQEETGNEVDAFVINGLRKKLPTIPKVLKKGGISKRKDIDTTLEIYLKAIRDNHLDPGDYAEILDILDGKGNTFFQRDTIYFNQDEIDEAGRELYSIYQRMTDDIPPIKAPSPLCTRMRSCPYRSLCIEDTPEARMNYRLKERELEELKA